MSTQGDTQSGKNIQYTVFNYIKVNAESTANIYG